MDKLKEMLDRVKKNKKTEVFKARLVKASSQFNTATFVVLQPGVVDRNGQQILENEIVKSSQEFMINLHEKAINFDHEENTDTQDAVFVENFILPKDMEMGITDFKKGTRFVGIKFSDELFEKVKNGQITGISMEGWANLE